jgi:hypothetical protein
MKHVSMMPRIAFRSGRRVDEGKGGAIPGPQMRGPAETRHIPPTRALLGRSAVFGLALSVGLGRGEVAQRSFLECEEGFAGEWRVLIPFVGIDPFAGGHEFVGEAGTVVFVFFAGGWAVGAGEFDEETRAARFAGDGLVDEGAGDTVAFVLEDDVDGADETLSAAARRDLAVARRG